MSINFIRDHAGQWPVRLMCRVLEVSASGYCAWRCRPESARSAATRKIVGWSMRDHMRTELPNADDLLLRKLLPLHSVRPFKGRFLVPDG